jgi:thioesterase domain-containing protein
MHGDLSFEEAWAQGRQPEVPGRKCMVQLADGDGTPLYLCHWSPGNIGFVREVTGLFSSGHPVYGFEAVGVQGRERPLLSIDEMAIRYLREIREVQPYGPYLLGGVCAGSQVAYQMAGLLREASEEVGPLILISGLRGALSEFPLLGLADMYEVRLAELRRRFGLSALMDDLPRVMDGLRALRWIDDRASQEDFFWQQVVCAACVYAHQRCVLRTFPGRVEVFLHRLAAADRGASWDDIAPDSTVRVFDADTSIEIMSDPAFAEVVRQSFEELRDDGRKVDHNLRRASLFLVERS